MAREKKKKKRQEEVVLTPEEKFAQLLALKKATRCILGVKDEYRIYVRLAKEFSEMGQKAMEQPFEGSEQCEGLSEECRLKAEELKPRIPKETDGESSRTVTTTMKEQERQDGRKGGKGKWAMLAAVVLLVAVIISCQFSPARYLLAGIEGRLGFYEAAKESYDKVADYRDGAKKAVDMEIARIADAQKGETVNFGNATWIVLESVEGNYKLLAKEEAMMKPYHDREEPVTWESSAIRAELNGSFLQETFSVGEREALREVECVNEPNPKYGTDAGADTVDKVYLPSADELEVYARVLGDRRKNMRLRTPGQNQISTAFVSCMGDIVEYGYSVTDRGACVRPVIQVRIVSE